MKPRPRIEADVVLFDQGNTLLMDPFLPVMHCGQERFDKIIKRHRLSVTIRELVEEWTKSNKSIDYPYIGHFTQEEPIVQDALRRLNVPGSIAGILSLDLLRAYRMTVLEVIQADPRTKEVRETLIALNSKGKRLGVFSNDRRVGLDFVLSAMELGGFFEYSQTSESTGIEKPDPRVFDHVLRAFGVPAATMVYVGDDPVRDIEPAKAKGLHAILYRVDVATYNERWRDYQARPRNQPDAVIDRLPDLLNLID